MTPDPEPMPDPTPSAPDLERADDGPQAAFWWRALAERVPSDRSAAWAALGFAALVFLPRLGSVGLWDPWETHYAEVAREMIVRGDYVHPHWESSYFFSKPAFPLWMMALGMLALGAEGFEHGALGAGVEWGVRLPTALIAILAVWAAYRLGRAISGRLTGLLAAVALGTCPQFVFIGKQAMVDMPFVGLMTIGLAFFVDAVFGDPEENEATPGPGLRYGSAGLVLVSVGGQALAIAGETGTALGWTGLVGLIGGAGGGAMVLVQRGRVRHARLAVFYVCAALSALSKGLAVLAVLGPTVLLYMLFARDWHLLLRCGVLWGGPLFLLVASPWYVVMSLFGGRDDEGLTFVQRFWFHDNLNRVGKGVHGDRGGLGYYVEQLAYGMFPWSAVLPAALVHAVGFDVRAPDGPDRSRRAIVFIVLWAVWTFVFFSASETKFHHYIFPAVPALAVLAAHWLAHLARDPAGRMQTFAWILVAAFLGAAAADLIDDPQNLVSLFTYKYDREYPRDVHPRVFLILFVSLFGAGLIVAHVLRRWSWQLLSLVGLGLATGLWCSHYHFNMLSPHWSQYHLWQTYFEEREAEEPIYAYQLNWRGEAFYSRNRVLQVMGKGANRRIRELVEQPGREFIITEQSRYDSLLNTLPSGYRDKLRILDQSNVHFYLMVVEE